MVNCWEEYMWKVHKAVPVDPWATNVQLLDVLIQERSTSLWLPPWLHKNKAPKSSRMSRVGSMLTLGFKDSSNQKAVANVSGGGAIDNNGAAATGSGEPSLNKNSPNDGTVGPTNVINNSTYSMPDIEASIRSSTSFLASITGGSSSSAQFDAKGSKTASCNVVGVKSQSVDLDALMELVTPRTSYGLPALWRPDISLPQLQWPCKRGQTLWVVTEIMYANKIKIEGDKEEEANAKAKVSKVIKIEGDKEEKANAEAKVVEVSEQVSVKKGGVWIVTAAKDNPTFPFALRLQRLNYDACGSLVTTKTKEFLKRNNSFTNKITRQLSSKRVDALSRSSSVSHVLS